MTINLDQWEKEAKLIYQTPAEFKRKKVIDVLEVNESAWANRCIALISELREAREAQRELMDRLHSAEEALKNIEKHSVNHIRCGSTEIENIARAYFDKWASPKEEKV